jgi:hypothetical protein
MSTDPADGNADMSGPPQRVIPFTGLHTSHKKSSESPFSQWTCCGLQHIAVTKKNESHQSSAERKKIQRRSVFPRTGRSLTSD